MKVLLTGATGFIGSHVAAALQKAGHEILPVGRDLLSLDFRLPSSSFDACVHLAWYVEPGKYLESPLNKEWVDASLRLARQVRATGCRRFIAAGTCFEYALTGQPLTETSPTDPLTVYARAKLDLLHRLQSLDLDLTWLRFFYQYGPREYPQRLVPTVIHSLLRGAEAKLVSGERVRDFLYIEDVARAVAAVVAGRLTGVVNIGSGQRTTIRQIAGTIGELMGRPELLNFGAIAYRPDEPLDVLADNTKLRSTGWSPRYDLVTGLRETIEWWRRHTAASPAR
jgi:nucleoside-diphosphate-sugar epimerase